ncbi:hypothetical protein [Rhizobium wenxiniae]|uniref:hypothetical protein n=1 Tax=Rhizobium wenxiniae TaxID=1737357 RepID=UPI001CB78B02|nr:hypothetical protein [Rhizobium wenxiniae]
MSNRKVQKIMPISATASSRQVEIGQTYSILSDPDGRWVAKRQEAINEGFEKRMRSVSNQQGGSKTASCGGTRDDSSHELSGTLSGESERIGRRDWNKNTPFGKHVGFF